MKKERVPLPTVVSLRDRFMDVGVRLIRLLPKGRRTCFRILRRLWGSPEFLFGRVDGQWFRVDTLDDDIAVTTLLQNGWEVAVSAIWIHLIQTGACVVDIGANKGYFSLLAARRVGPNGRLISYEPHPRNARDIKLTAAANRHDHWTVRVVAASNESGNRTFYTPGWDEGVSGWGSFERTEGESIDVGTVRLDDDLEVLGVQRVSVMKLDIEGHEFEALCGAESLLRGGMLENVLIEVHLKELGADRVGKLFELFESSGYTGFQLLENALSKREWRAIRDGRRPFVEADLLSVITAKDLEKFDISARPHVLWRRC